MATKSIGGSYSMVNGHYLKPGEVYIHDGVTYTRNKYDFVNSNIAEGDRYVCSNLLHVVILLTGLLLLYLCRSV